MLKPEIPEYLERHENIARWRPRLLGIWLLCSIVIAALAPVEHMINIVVPFLAVFAATSLILEVRLVLVFREDLQERNRRQQSERAAS